MKQGKLRFKYIFFSMILLVALLPASLVAYLLLQQIENSTIDQVDNELARISEQIVRQVASQQQALNVGLGQLVARSEIRQGIDSLQEVDPMRQALDNFRASTPLVDSVFVIDAVGSVVASSGGNIGQLEESSLLDKLLEGGLQSGFRLVHSPELVAQDNRQFSDYSLVSWLPFFKSVNRATEELAGFILVNSAIDQLFTPILVNLQPGEVLQLRAKDQLLASNVEHPRPNSPLVHRTELVLKHEVAQSELILDLKIEQPKSWLSHKVEEALSTLYGLLFSGLALVVVFSALVTSGLIRIFNRLMAIVRQYELGHYSEASAYQPLIYEVRQVVQLLQRMAQRIQGQLADLRDKNRSLAEMGQRLQEANQDLERRVQERTEQLNLMARTDAMTETGNRQAFEEDHAVCCQGKRHYALFVIDINGLKQVNDELGHLAGDLLICAAANTIRNNCREEDSIYRMGGDEFVLLLRGGDQLACERVANRLRQANSRDSIVVESQHGGSVSVPVRLSFGYATSRDVGQQNVFDVADQRMYQAKREFYRAFKGRARYRYSA